MTKAQLLFDPSAECEQPGLLPRGRNDLNAERPLSLTSWRRQGEYREADERDDEGNGEIVDRRFEADVVNLHHVTRVVLPRENRRCRYDKEILPRQQITKTAVDGGTPPLGGQIIPCRELAARFDVPDNGRREFGPPIPQQRTIAVRDMRGPQRAERLDGATAVGGDFLDVGAKRARISFATGATPKSGVIASSGRFPSD